MGLPRAPPASCVDGASSDQGAAASPTCESLSTPPTHTPLGHSTSPTLRRPSPLKLATLRQREDVDDLAQLSPGIGTSPLSPIAASPLPTPAIEQSTSPFREQQHAGDDADGTTGDL